MQLQSVDSGFRLIYAFEIDYKPCITVPLTSDLSNGTTLSVDISQAAGYGGTDSCTISSTSDFAALGSSQYVSPGFGFGNEWDLLGSEVTTSSSEEEKQKIASGSKGEASAAVVEPDSTVNIGGQQQTEEGDDDVFSNMTTFGVDSLKQIDSGQARANTASSSSMVVEDASNLSKGGLQEQGEAEAGNGDGDQKEVPSSLAPSSSSKDTGNSSDPALAGASSCPPGPDPALAGASSCPPGPDDDDIKTEVGDQGQISDVKDELNANWHICVICLEEMPSDQLLIHAICQGKLCHQCVSVSHKNSTL